MYAEAIFLKFGETVGDKRYIQQKLCFAIRTGNSWKKIK